MQSECFSIEDLEAMADKVLLIDVRGPEEFASAHVEGALNVPLDQLADRADELPQNVQIVAICGKGGGRSAEAAEQLRALGLVNAKWLCGGTNAWLERHSAG